MRSRSSLLVLSLGAAVACEDETLPDENLIATSVAVSPADFLGQATCGQLEGGPTLYVATFTDAAGTVLGSSPPVSCLLPVAYERVRVGEEYLAQVDVYTTNDLRPQVFAGRVMVDGAGAVVMPAASSSCEKSRSPDGTFSGQGVTASLNERVFLRGCTPFTLTEDNAAVVVDPTKSLGGGACSLADVTVERFLVTPSDPSFPSAQVPCGGTPVRYTPSVAGQAYTFRVEAFAPGATDAFAATKCDAVGRAKLPVLATCDALSSEGNVTVNLGSAFQTAGLACGTDVGRVRIATGDADPTLGREIPCDAGATLGPFPSGAWKATFVAQKPDGSFLATGTCTSTVVAGATSAATCALD